MQWFFLWDQICGIYDMGLGCKYRDWRIGA
jgi:hypothetical protein